MKRVLKWVAIILGVPLALAVLAPVFGILGIVGYYHHIVGAMPGGLEVGVTAGPLGAMVNVFAGTGGLPYLCPHDSPAATTPFGMVRLGPDTESMIIHERCINRSGYYYGDNRTIGFSHTRLVGADAKEGGVFRFFPTVASRVEAMRGKDRFARFSHRDETAFPGYYAVRLPKDDVLVELTATPRVGVHRYTFHKNDAPHLLVDVTSVLGDGRCEDGVVLVRPETQELEGKIKIFGSFSGRYDGLDVYFVAKFSRPFAAYGTWIDGRFTPGATGASGKDAGVDLTFAKSGATEVVEARVALSYVAIKNARMNLEAEAAGKSFEDVAAAAKEAWEQRLSAIRIEGGTERQRRIFYTALYHTFNMPTVFNDVNGEYMGFDRAVHKAEGFRYYTDMSLWDTVRTVHPLYNLIARADQRDFMVSLVEMVKAGGCLPRWPSGCGYTNCMFGTPADLAVSEAYQKGVRDFDVQTAYQAMRKTGLTGKPPSSRFAGREGLDEYVKLGYCPSDKMGDSVAATLEFAYEDNAIGRLAEALGYKEDAAVFAEHARSYRNLWNPEMQYFMPKDSAGAFMKREDFRPLLLTYADFKGKYTRAYVEGSALQWRWFVPHDPEGLISLFKSREYFIGELDEFFAKSNTYVGKWNPGPYYWQGNEPDIHAVYLFNAAGRPDLTQKYVRQTLETKHEDNYIGLDGNDDGGTLSAWYVFSALGFYPVAGTTKYQLGSPLFDKAEMRIGDKILTIVATNNSAENVYVQKVSLNDVPLDHPWFAHDQIAQGGTLRFDMGPTPPAGVK